MGRGRKPLGEKKVSKAEKQKRYRERNQNIIKEKDQKRKKISRAKFKKDFPLLHEAKVKDESANRKQRRQAKQELVELMVVNIELP